MKGNDKTITPKKKNVVNPETFKEKAQYHLYDMFISLVQAGFMALVIYNFVFQLSKVQGKCMEHLLYTGDRVFVNKFIYNFRDIYRGDIIVFKAPPNPELDFIKRVIGLPGDRVEIKNGFVYINGKVLKEDYVPEYMFGDIEEFTVPDNAYFVLGDNRNNSNDSRFWGFVPRAHVRGKAIFKFWPIPKIAWVE